MPMQLYTYYCTANAQNNTGWDLSNTCYMGLLRQNESTC